MNSESDQPRFGNPDSVKTRHALNVAPVRYEEIRPFRVVRHSRASGEIEGNIGRSTANRKKMAVVGAGASGAEIASAYARLGSEVMLFEALDRVLTTEDADGVTEIVIGRGAAGPVTAEN